MKSRLWTPYFVLIVTVAFFGSFMAQGLSSTVPVFVEHLGASLTEAGMLSAVFPVVAVAVRLVCGFVVDTRGRRSVMLVGAIVLIVGVLGAGFSPNLWVYALMRALQGFGWAAMTTAAATAAADVLPADRRGEGIGYYGLGQAISMSIGPAFSLFFVSTDPPQNVYYALGAFGSIAIICALLCTYEKHPERLPEDCGYVMMVQAHGGDVNAVRAAQLDRDSLVKQIRGSFEGRVWFAMIPAILIGTGYGFSLYYGGYYGLSIGIADVGWYYTISALAMLGVRLLSRRYLDTVAPFRILFVACACGVIGFSLWIGASAQPILFFVASVFYGAFLGINVPLNQSVAIKAASMEHWGMASAAYQIANDVGYIIGLLVWGATGEVLGLVVTLYFVVGCVALAIPGGWLCYPNHGRR